MIPRPQSDEFAPYYGQYINRVPAGSDLFAILSRQPEDLRDLLQSVAEPQASTRPAPEEWSVKEVLGHICDAERIFAYRTLRVVRADETPLPGFEQDDYVAATDFNQRSLVSLLDEFDAQRRSNMLCFQPFTNVELVRRGTASSSPVSVRALLYMMAGHVIHHFVSLRDDYKVGG